MKLQYELAYLENGVITKDELKTHCKVEAVVAIKEERYDDVAICLNEIKKLTIPNVAPGKPQTSGNDKTIDKDDVKAAINKIKSKTDYDGHQLTIDEVIDEIDPNLKGNQDLRNLVANVLGNK